MQKSMLDELSRVVSRKIFPLLWIKVKKIKINYTRRDPRHYTLRVLSTRRYATIARIKSGREWKNERVYEIFGMSRMENVQFVENTERSIGNVVKRQRERSVSPIYP